MTQISSGSKKSATRIVLVDNIRTPGLSETVAKRVGFKGEYKTFLFLPTENVLYVGTKWSQKHKSADPYDKPDYFELGAASWRELEKLKPTELSISNLSAKPLPARELERFVLGILQASWKFDQFLPAASKGEELKIYLDMAAKSNLSAKQQAETEQLHQAMILVRQLVEQPPEQLNPSSIVKLVKEALPSGIKLDVLSKAELEKLGMKAILAVGRGSVHEPVLVHATLPAKGQVKQRICLVGKGITYDSGGLDIKTEGHMRTMKMDMAGAATMLGSLVALAGLNLRHIEVHFIAAFAENMISGASYKSDDIITTYSGQTVEVQNTDAEGRLTLADALCYATLLEPDYIIDAATLTGAAVVAVSPYYSAVMGNDGQLIEEIIKYHEQEGEFAVHTPLPEVLRPHVTGKLSDLINTSTLPRLGGHLTAGLFLSHFVDQRQFRNPQLKLDQKKAYPWVHLDIAGSAYNEGQNRLKTFGATGNNVRSLVSWIVSKDR